MASDSEILNFYKNRNILITGGTGFIGKILIQKLLRECDDLSGIYLIVREKKGKDAHARLEDMFKDTIFDKLKEHNPDYAKKIFLIQGNCSKPGLGLTDDDRQMVVEKINIIFNMAASLNMDSKLRDAVETNVRGIQEMLKLCHEMKNLVALVHVSTAYSNCNNYDIEESFYKPKISPAGLIGLTNEVDERILDNITPGLLDDLPNTYAYTKSISEDIIHKELKRLPLALFRPSIVTNVYEDPIPGWIDNVYGPCGILTASGLGVLRVLHCDQIKRCDMVPVDFCTNALIACPWDLLNNKRLKDDEQVPVYNYSAGPKNSNTWEVFRDYVLKLYKYPSTHAFWKCQLYFIKNFYLYYFLRFFLHNVPAYLVDGVLFILGRQRKAVRIYTKLHKFTNVLSYFTTNDFNIINSNVYSMWDNLNKKDKALFPFDMNALNWEKYYDDICVGIKFYLLKEDPKNVERDQQRYKKLERADFALKIVLSLLLLWMFYNVVSLFL